MADGKAAAGDLREAEHLAAKIGSDSTYVGQPVLAQRRCLLCCHCLQLSLLATNGTLNVINSRDWSFGQTVAVTIWAAPLAEYRDLSSRKFNPLKGFS